MTYPVAVEDIPCPLGCPRHDVAVVTASDLLHGQPGDYTLVRCQSCGLMRTTPRPTVEGMARYYPDTYGPYLGTQVAPQARERPWRRLAKTLVRCCVDFKTDSLPPLPPGRLLEIGCASGSFLHRMAGEGWRVQGIEFSPSAAASARSLGYPVHTGSLETAPDPEAPYDLVVGWMVLEHLHKPLMALRRLRQWVKPGGWLVLSLPNAASLEFNIFGPDWYALQLPTHLFHYTPQSLARMVEAAGWRLERIHHQRTLANLVGSLGLALRRRGHGPWVERLVRFPQEPGWWGYALFPAAWLLSQWGQTGRMTAWLRNPE